MADEPEGDAGVADRLLEARLTAGVRLRQTVSQDRMAELVSEQLGRALHKTQWRRYESGEREPPLNVIRAAARVSGLSESYIAFGPAPAEQPGNSHEPAAASADPKRGAKQSRGTPAVKSTDVRKRA